MTRASPAEGSRLDPEHELLRAERLGDVIVGAEREAANAIDLFLARREHHDGDAAGRVVALQFFEDFEPRHAGQHEIEHDQRRVFTARDRQRVRTRRRRRHAVSGLREMVDDERDDIGLVVHDEHALAGRRYVRGRAHCAPAEMRRAIAPTRRSMATVLCPPRGTITSA